MSRVGAFAVLCAVTLLAFATMVVDTLARVFLDPVFAWVDGHEEVFVLCAVLFTFCAVIFAPYVIDWLYARAARERSLNPTQPAPGRSSSGPLSGGPTRTPRRDTAGGGARRPRRPESTRSGHPSLGQGLGGRWQ